MRDLSPPLFKTRALEALTRTHPVVPVLVHAPILVALLVAGIPRAGAPGALGCFAFGYLVWTLMEYWVHRALFHLRARRPAIKRLVFLLHGVHHEHPHDPGRLVLPPTVSLPIALADLLIARLLLGTAGWMCGAAGFLAGYLAYDMIHYWVHCGRPRGRLGRALRRKHLRHHFADDSTGFGVSAPYWDRVFGTQARPLAQRGGGS